MGMAGSNTPWHHRWFCLAQLVQLFVRRSCKFACEVGLSPGVCDITFHVTYGSRGILVALVGYCGLDNSYPLFCDPVMISATAGGLLMVYVSLLVFFVSLLIVYVIGIYVTIRFVGAVFIYNYTEFGGQPVDTSPFVCIAFYFQDL